MTKGVGAHPNLGWDFHPRRSHTPLQPKDRQSSEPFQGIFTAAHYCGKYYYSTYRAPQGKQVSSLNRKRITIHKSLLYHIMCAKYWLDTYSIWVGKSQKSKEYQQSLHHWVLPCTISGSNKHTEKTILKLWMKSVAAIKSLWWTQKWLKDFDSKVYLFC